MGSVGKAPGASLSVLQVDATVVGMGALPCELLGPTWWVTQSPRRAAKHGASDDVCLFRSDMRSRCAVL